MYVEKVTFGKTKKFKIIKKTFKKSVDNLKGLCYYVQARSRAKHLSGTEP